MSKILIVDDYRGTLETLKYILESNGYKVKTLKNTLNIYREIDEFNPDLLMLDLLLEGEDGRQICKNLKTGFEYRDLRILVFSAFSKRLETTRWIFGPSKANGVNLSLARKYKARPRS